METAQRRMPNKSFNADIMYSENTEISLKHEEMERDKHFVGLYISNGKISYNIYMYCLRAIPLANPQ